MVKTHSKNDDGKYHGSPPQEVGATTLPGHGNTGHPNSSDPEKRGGRKSNRRKKSMKKKGKTAKKRKTKKARKPKRRRVGSGIITDGYRAAHKAIRGRESKGETAEKAEKAERIAEANKRVAGWLQDIRDSGDYNELNDVSELKVGNTYFEFYGEDAQLRHLGKFIKEERTGNGNYLYGNNFDLIFDNYVLTGFNKGGEVFPPVTSLKGRVFETNVAGVMEKKVGKDIGEKIASFGGRKRKTRKTKKSRRARN